MAQVSYGSITITDTNDIESITIQYAQNQSTSNAPETGWSTTRPTWAQGYYIWQRTVTHRSGTDTSTDIIGPAVCLTGSTGQTGSAGRSLTNSVTQYTTAAASATINESNMGQYTWVSNVPTYSSSTPAYWVRITNTYSNPSSTEYIIYKDNGITDAIKTSNDANTTAGQANQTANQANQTANQANQTANQANQTATAANNLATGINQHFWSLAEDTTTTGGTLAAGQYITDILQDNFKQNPNSSGNLLLRSDGVYLNLGLRTLASFKSNALIFYNAAGGELGRFGSTGLDMSGNLNIKGGGRIGQDTDNYWKFGDYTSYASHDMAYLMGYGEASIQLGEQGHWRLDKNRIHAGWYQLNDATLGVLHFDTAQDTVEGVTNTYYWDYGLNYPNRSSNTGNNKFVYIRRSNNTTDTTLATMKSYIDDDAWWTYKFYIDGAGNLHAGDIYSNGQLISGQSAPYLLKSGGTMTGDITMSNGSKIVGDVSGSASKLSNTSKIGDINQPVYFTANGVPTAISYTIDKSVPSNAIFTDENVQTTNVNDKKIYLAGTQTAGTNTGKLNYDSNVYIDTTAGALHATTYNGYTLAAASAKGVDTSMPATATNNNVPTTLLMKTFVEGKGYRTETYSLTQDSTDGHKITLTPSSGTAQTITIPDNNTTYTFANGTNGFTVTPSGGTAQTVTVTPSIANNVTGSGTNGYLAKFTGANTIGNGPALGSDTTKFLNNKGEWAVPAGTYTYTLPLAANGTRGGVQIGYTQSGKNYPVQLSSEKMYVNVPWENTTYSAGSGLTLSGTTFNHSNSVTAGTAGTSSATSGATLAVPYVTYDAQGHITGSGTHTHTINNLSADTIIGGYLNIHPENSPTLIPFMHNDIAHLLKRGGSAIIKYDNTTQSLDLTSCFDGSGSYWAINPTGVTTITIELTLHKVFAWGNTIYVDFGNTGWRAKSVKIELMNSNYTNDTWTQKYSTTTNSLGHIYVNTSHQPVGADNTGGGFNKIRFTFSDWNSSTIFRIAQLGVYNYGSTGLRETYMSRGVDDYVFRSITPNNNNTYTLGSSSYKWNNVYATTLTGTLDGPVKDSGNGTATTFAYSKSGLTTASWLAAWSGYELRAISPSVTKGLLNLSKSDVGLGNVLNEAQVTGIGSNNGKLRVYKGTNYEDVTVEIVATESTTATTATKLSSYAGTQYQPVYFPSSGTNQGKPVGITDSNNNAITIQKSVPANAVFTDTTYTAGSGLTLDGTQFKHSNSVTAGTVSDGGNTRTLSFGGTFKIPSVTYDAQGHITSTGTITLTMPAAPTSTGTADAFSSAATVALTGDTTGSASSTKGWSITTTTDRATVTYCRDDASANANKELWNAFRNGTTGAQPGKVRFFSIYGADTSKAPTTYGEMIEITHANSNHYQPQLWFGPGKLGALYHRNKEYNNDSWGAWHTVLDSNNYTTYTIKKDGTGASGSWGISITGSASKLGTSNVGSARQPIYLSAGSPTAGNYTVAHLGNAGKSNMNDVGRLHSSTGMTNLTDPSNTTDNPMNGTTKSTSWHLYWDTNYTDDPNGSNSWAAQIVNKAGTAQWWVRSRSGGTITNGTAWAADWKHLVVAPQAGQGSATVPIYIDANGHTQSITSYSGNAATATEFSSNATVTLTGDTTGTSAGSKKSWSISTTTARLSSLGRRTTAATIALNPSVDTGFKMTWHISDSSSRTADATNSPSFDCGIINIPWDWGAYNGQIALQNTVAGNTRMQIRSATAIDNGESANPRYTPNYGAWREVVTATKATQIGSTTQPVYVSNTGQITAGTSIGASAYHADDYFVKRAGDTMTGALNTANGTANKIGDDSQLGDFNVGGTLGIQGLNSTTGIGLLQQGTTWGSSGNYAHITYDGTYINLNKLFKITTNGNTVTIGSQNASFTHIYNSLSIPFIFNNSVLTTNGNLGNTSYPFTDIFMKGGLNMLVNTTQKARMAYDDTLAAIVFSFA